jgi:hypothetical protein
MDVVLDANIYLSDPRMEGVAFRSLLDYLRKTQSTLIIPQIVFDEIIARYPELLSAQWRKAFKEVHSFRRLMLGSRVAEIPEVDLARAVRVLKKKLLKPFKHVTSIKLGNFDDIDPKDVARRGVERIAPASGKGEELRDVMVWLMVLGHIQNSHRDTAFITADQHFAYEGKLHPQLANELQDKKLILHFYLSIDEFIKAHAPAPKELTAARAFQLYGKPHVLDRFEIESRRYFPDLWRNFRVTEVKERDVQFTRGALYEVGSDSQYGEMEFSGELKLRVANQLQQFSGVPIQWDDTQLSSTQFPDFESVKFSSPIDESWILTTAHAFDSSNAASIKPTAILAPTTTFLIGSNESATDYKVSGRLVISIRLVSGKVTHVETEGFARGEVTSLQSSKS